MSNKNNDGHVGMVAIVGRPNVGKSTLLNRILGEKIAIVSNRPQTTRNRILGILTSGKDQLVMLDTPGIHQRRANINRFMVREALGSIDGVDCIILMIEAVRLKESAVQAYEISATDSYVLTQIQKYGLKTPVLLVINKIDRLTEHVHLLPVIETWQEKGFECIVPISALKGDGVDVLLKEVMHRLPRGPLLYPEEMITDRAERFLAGELIREQVFHVCRLEIPYSTAVEILSFAENTPDGEVTIEAVIHIERESQKGILIGKKGAQIKKIGTMARREIAKILGCTVHLKLTVHVEKDWSHVPARRHQLGYE